MTATPECDKMRAVNTESQAIGEFLEWAGMQGMVFCEWNEEFYGYTPVHKTINTLLADHFGIDLNKVEAEKRAILESLRDGP